MQNNNNPKKVATSKDLVSGYYTKERKTPMDFNKAQEKEKKNLIKHFAMGDKRNWY